MDRADGHRLGSDSATYKFDSVYWRRKLGENQDCAKNGSCHLIFPRCDTRIRGLLVIYSDLTVVSGFFSLLSILYQSSKTCICLESEWLPCPKNPPNAPSTHTPTTAVPSSPSQVQTLLSSQGTRGRARDTVYRRDTRPKSSNCAFFCWKLLAPNSTVFDYRTDKAVLAVNGFAADGNMFVKKVRQRLEVSR